MEVTFADSDRAGSTRSAPAKKASDAAARKRTAQRLVREASIKQANTATR
jgi:hypothetical protein